MSLLRGIDDAMENTPLMNRRELLLTTAALASSWQYPKHVYGQEDNRNMAHFEPAAKQAIFIFLAGGPSQFDLFENKPLLNQQHGKPIPQSIVGNERFAFLEQDTPKLIRGTKAKFQPHGESGIEFSNRLPYLATCADDLSIIKTMHTDDFDHHAAQLILNTGVKEFGRPSMGAWLNFALGSDATDLPGHFILWAGESLWSSQQLWTNGFLPGHNKGIILNDKPPGLNFLENGFFSQESNDSSIELIKNLNELKAHKFGSKISKSSNKTLDLAKKLGKAIPPLIDLSSEPKRIFQEYGIERTFPPPSRWNPRKSQFLRIKLLDC